jgi:hypothetical protein
MKDKVVKTRDLHRVVHNQILIDHLPLHIQVTNTQTMTDVMDQSLANMHILIKNSLMKVKMFEQNIKKNTIQRSDQVIINLGHLLIILKENLNLVITLILNIQKEKNVEKGIHTVSLTEKILIIRIQPLNTREIRPYLMNDRKNLLRLKKT